MTQANKASATHDKTFIPTELITLRNGKVRTAMPQLPPRYPKRRVTTATP